MPYTYKKEGGKYVVYKKSTGQKVGSTDGTKEALRKYLAALHMNEKQNNNINMKHIKSYQDFINESKLNEDSASYEKWKKALHLYDTSNIESDINRHDAKGVKPSASQDKELSRIFKGSKLTSRFIMRADFGKWKKEGTEKNYEKDCADFGKSKVDELVDKVISVYESNESESIDEANVNYSFLTDKKSLDYIKSKGVEDPHDFIDFLKGTIQDNLEDDPEQYAAVILKYYFDNKKEMDKYLKDFVSHVQGK